jgi:hypothetical protein
LVGGNEQLVGENAIAFSCSEAGNFHLASGSQTSSSREAPRSLGLSSATDAMPPEGAPRGDDSPDCSTCWTYAALPAAGFLQHK